MHPYALMIKPVGASCNLNCSYCYYLHNEVSDRKKITHEHLEKVISSYLQSGQGKIFSFVWHGGEPCLAGLDFYKEFISLQKKYLPAGAECWNNLQSNALLLNEEWCAFLKKEKFDVGISIDGIRLVHDTYRRDPAGNATYDKVAEKIQLLKKYGIRPDLLCTVTSDTAAHAYEVWQALKNFHTGWIQFIPIVNKKADDSLKEESVSAKAYGNFLITVFHQWLYNDLGKNDVQFFMELLNICMGGSASLCWLRKECGDVLAIESDGSIYSCDHYVNKDHLLGNIDDNNLSECLESQRQRNFAARKSSLNEKCKSCKYLHLCNGGCPKDRDAQGNNLLCEGLYAFFEEACEPLQEAATLLKEGHSTDDVMKILKQKRKERWKDISGNSPCPCHSGRKYKHCCMK